MSVLISLGTQKNIIHAAALTFAVTYHIDHRIMVSKMLE